MGQWIKPLVTITMAICLTGCATNKYPVNPNDPYESFNRKMYSFNTGLDKVLIKPGAVTYDRIVPWPAQKGISNFFSNIEEIPTVANDLLQFNLAHAISDTWRFAINTTVGIGGLLDVASHMGLPNHKEDFGLTLAKWGVKRSPYIVLPILGPSTVRDAVAFPINYQYMTIWPYVNPQKLRYGLLLLHATDLRAELLPSDKLMAESFDPYIFVRDAYLQKRTNDIENNQTHKDTFVEPLDKEPTSNTENKHHDTVQDKKSST